MGVPRQVPHRQPAAHELPIGAVVDVWSLLKGNLQQASKSDLVSGTLTNVCCESSARDAMMLGCNVIMLSDANATLTDEEHAAALNTFSMFFGDVMTTGEVFARVSALASSDRDNVASSEPVVCTVSPVCWRP